MNKIVFGDAQNLAELENDSIDLVVTSPPYFNSPFDYPDLFESYAHFIDLMRNVARELVRTVKDGRIVALVVDDIALNGKRYPVVADMTRLFIDGGFTYREKIVWMKPKGYIAISRRSGNLLKFPYPMYYYSDNLHETILIFQNGAFNYKKVSQDKKEASSIDTDVLHKEGWFRNVWKISNVMPNHDKLERGIAKFPEEIPFRLIKLYSYEGDFVLDPFMGAGDDPQGCTRTWT